MQHSVKIKVGTVVPIPVFRNQRQEDYHELWASVAFRVNFMSAWLQYDTLL